jgi:hypothetical protein
VELERLAALGDALFDLVLDAPYAGIAVEVETAVPLHRDERLGLFHALGLKMNFACL